MKLETLTRRLLSVSPALRLAAAALLASGILALSGCDERKPAPEVLLSKGRVKVAVKWRNQYSNQSGTALGTAQNDKIGTFYFTGADNTEVFVKVLDFGPEKPYILFHGGLTDFEYAVTFTNVATGKSLTLKKDAGKLEGGLNNTDLAH